MYNQNFKILKSKNKKNKINGLARLFHKVKWVRPKWANPTPFDNPTIMHMIFKWYRS